MTFLNPPKFPMTFFFFSHFLKRRQFSLHNPKKLPHDLSKSTKKFSSDLFKAFTEIFTTFEKICRFYTAFSLEPYRALPKCSDGVSATGSQPISLCHFPCSSSF